MSRISHLPLITFATVDVPCHFHFSAQSGYFHRWHFCARLLEDWVYDFQNYCHLALSSITLRHCPLSLLLSMTKVRHAVALSLGVTPNHQSNTNPTDVRKRLKLVRDILLVANQWYSKWWNPLDLPGTLIGGSSVKCKRKMSIRGKKEDESVYRRYTYMNLVIYR